MTPTRRKAACLTLEGLNAFACAYYFNYLFFLLRDQFGFGNRGNLMVSALHGLIYVASAWFGGRFAQRHGYLTALRMGSAGMGLALLVGSAFPTIAGQVLALAGWTFLMCFTWPALEALVSEGEGAARLPQMVGLYNVVWAGSSAIAYLIGGALIERLGDKSIYWLPAAVYAAIYGGATWLARQPGSPTPTVLSPVPPAHTPEPEAFRQPVSPARFLQMAWLANPFAYIAINTILAVIPQIAAKLHLTTTETGIFCSLWFFVRLGAFVLLWQWTKWHYKFRWLLAAFLALIASFTTLLLASPLWLLVLAQIVFGLATGLIYYSSLFYSMEIGETKGEHGGLHEAAIGAGIFAGPAVGASALWLAPARANAGTWAVSALLLCGLVGLVTLRLRRGRSGGSKN